MALAKHHEEIEERWIASTSDRYESLLADLFNKLPPKLPRAGEVYLSRSGRRMEDIEVCEVGETLDLAMTSTPGAAAPEIAVVDDSGNRNLKQRSNGQISLAFKEPGTRRIKVSSGGFLKLYTIHAIEPARLEELPDFAKLIHSLSDNPPEWTDASFGEFRVRLEEILAKKGVPAIFAEGVVEYHLGLFHEERRMSSFRERFESAYGDLRWFIPYSDVARLICTYFLYCANEFEAAEKLCRGRAGRLRNAANFFLEHDGTEQTKNGRASRKTGPPLLVALPDLVTFQAIEALDAGRTQDAVELLSVARKHTRADFDRERTARLSFMEASAKAAMGEDGVSRSIFESLQHCPWRLIAVAAAKKIDHQRNG